MKQAVLTIKPVCMRRSDGIKSIYMSRNIMWPEHQGRKAISSSHQLPQNTKTETR